jgi:hypothetical protein
METRDQVRRKALLKAHYDAENENDIEKILGTFAPNGELVFNLQTFTGLDQIRQAHVYMGFSGDGAIAGLHNVVDREFLTEHDVIVEGRARGVLRGEFQGYAPTNQPVELPFIAIYRFDEHGKLVSEHVVMNLAGLGAPPTWQPS